MIYVAETFRIRPGTIEPFVEAAYGAIDASRREPGCLLYDLHASVTDPDRQVCIEQWDSRECFDRHSATAHMAIFRDAIKPFVISSRVEIIYPEHVETI
ncbi:MAG: putative quinol monooxygenase [Devosia sp.]